MVDRMLKPEEVARLLQVSEATIRQWRYRKQGPPSTRLGHSTVRYSEAALLEWIAQRETKREDG